MSDPSVQSGDTNQPVPEPGRAHTFFARLHIPHVGARNISIFASLIVGLLLFVFLSLARRLEFYESVPFWISLLVGFAIYVVIQQWTLANQTARGDEAAAALDKFVALVPFIVAVSMEVFWINRSSPLMFDHHFAAVLFSLYSVGDFFWTDITNQRLRMRQFNLGGLSS